MAANQRFENHLFRDIPIMDRQEKITVNIINRNYPPGPGITGESANEFAGFLLQKNFTVNIIHVNALYQGGGMLKAPVGNSFGIKTFYNGKGKIMRLLANVYEGWALIKKSKSLKPDITICLTDPPLLNMWASILLNKKSKWILWSMDIYPEAFLAANLITEKNIFFKKINKILIAKPPHYLIALGPYQSDYLIKKYSGNVSSSLLPCGVYEDVNMAGAPEEMPEWAADRSKIYLGYCGNLGEAHSLSFLRTVIDNIDTSKFSFIFSVYGKHAKELLEFAKDKPGVIILPSVKRTHLKFIDLHLASLKKQWINVCVPSKTVSSVCAGSVFLYHGFAASDNWELLQNAGWRIEPGNDAETQIKCFLKDITAQAILDKKTQALQVAKTLNAQHQQSFEDIYQWMVANA
jgi:hypothetical protein